MNGVFRYKIVGIKNRLRTHYHSKSSAKGIIINAIMLVICKITDVTCVCIKCNGMSKEIALRFIIKADKWPIALLKNALICDIFITFATNLFLMSKW